MELAMGPFVWLALVAVLLVIRGCHCGTDDCMVCRRSACGGDRRLDGSGTGCPVDPVSGCIPCASDLYKTLWP